MGATDERHKFRTAAQAPSLSQTLTMAASLSIAPRRLQRLVALHSHRAGRRSDLTVPLAEARAVNGKSDLDCLNVSINMKTL